MGAFLMVEAGYEPSQLMTRLRSYGGKGVLSFLLALFSFCNPDEGTDANSDKELREWFTHLQTFVEQPLCDVFKPIVDCMWGDSGEFGPDFLEDEYQWYVKRNPQTDMTEAEFQQSVREGMKHWQPIDAVMSNVKLVINLFKIKGLGSIEGYYTAKELTDDMIPQFESLYDTLTILKKNYYEVVRLTFY
jgi:hypothetical protein